MPLLRAACPSYEPRWAQYIREPVYEPGLLHIDVADFALHLVDLAQADRVQEAPEVFAVIETILDRSDTYVREAIVASLLEDIQNVAANTGLDPGVFERFLGTRAKHYWDRLNEDFGKAPGAA